jgi:hypothetical protein
MEVVWQMLVGEGESDAGWKRPDITLPDRLFISAVFSIPRERRPWGSITWLSEVYRTSRETIYTIGRRARAGLLFEVEESPSGVESVARVLEPTSTDAPTIAVTDNRVKRTILTGLLPGGATLRPMQDVLGVAFDQSRAVGSLSEVINEAGRRAGKVLSGIDYSPLGNVILARDETYFDSQAFLLSVEPRSYVIVSGYVEESFDGETWGVSLAIDQQTRGFRIIGLAEDAARCYPKSLKQAAKLLETEFSVPVQKDVWHILDKAGQTLRDLERSALKQLEKAEDEYQAALKAPGDDACLAAWVEAEDAADGLLEMSHQFHFWYGCLCDALELVDWRSGEIRDRAINQWLLDETLKRLRQLGHVQLKKLVTTLENQYAELLTFLDWLEVQLIPWQQRLAHAFPDPADQAFFQATVARAWRLNRALVNGHQQFQTLADDAQAWLAELIADDPPAQRLAEELLTILEGTIRTSCAAETVNSILKPYLWVKRSFQSRETAQNFLNLFILWFNMHVFKRGKRAGKSPFQWAGIKVYTPDGRETDDWLAALGYPADA